LVLTLGLSSANANGYATVPEEILILGGSTPTGGSVFAGAITLAAYLEPAHTHLSDSNFRYSSSFGDAYMTVAFFWDWEWTSGADPTLVTNDQIEFIATFHFTGGTETLTMGPYPFRPGGYKGGLSSGDATMLSEINDDVDEILDAVQKTWP
jgi:hypothetical protein